MVVDNFCPKKNEKLFLVTPLKRQFQLCDNSSFFAKIIKQTKTFFRSLFRKTYLFFRLNNQKKKLLIEAYIYILIAFVFIRITSFKNYSLLFKKKEAISNTYSTEKINLLKKEIYSAIKIAAKYTPWKSICYDQSIAAKIMLNKRNIENTLYIGTGIEDNEYIFHAWVESQGYIVAGRGEINQFTIIAQFPTTRISEKK